MGGTPKRTGGYIYVEDVGPLLPESGGDDNTGTVVYESVWKATESRRYRKDGAAIAGHDGEIETWFWGAAPEQFDGSGWVYGDGAVESTDSVEFGKTLPQALVGATIYKVEVYLRNKTWWAGGVQGLALSSLASSVLPATKKLDATFWSADMAEGEGRWIEVPPAWFNNGANRGIGLGDKDGQAFNDSGTLETPGSGSFHGPGDSDPPLLRITYSR